MAASHIWQEEEVQPFFLANVRWHYWDMFFAHFIDFPSFYEF